MAASSSDSNRRLFNGSGRIGFPPRLTVSGTLSHLLDLANSERYIRFDGLTSKSLSNWSGTMKVVGNSATISSSSLRPRDGKMVPQRGMDPNNKAWIYQIEIRNPNGDILFEGKGVQTKEGKYLPTVALWGTKVVTHEGYWPCAKPQAVEFAGKRGSFPFVVREGESPSADVGSVPAAPLATVLVESGNEQGRGVFRRYFGCTVTLSDGQQVKAVAMP
jgi:hypothetical protein